MAEWNKGKVLPADINKGQEFITGDNLAVNELNAIVNNSFYASEKAENAEKLVEEALAGNIDLSNYYTKDETYSKQEVDNLIDDIETGGGTSIVVDTELNAESTNPVQNKVLYNPVTFAESERQKSKNLFSLETVDGNGGKSIKLSKSLPVGTYTLSAIVTSGSSDAGCLVEAYANGKWITVFSMSKGITQRTSSTRDLTSPIDEFRFYAGASDIGSHAFNFSKIQLEEGSVATDYQPYNGAIVHEKDIEHDVLTVQLDVTNWYHPVKETYSQLPLSLYNSTGTKLSLNNNRIYIGQGVKKVKVSGKIQIDHPSGGMYSYAKVFKNTQEMSLSNCGSTQAFTTNMPIIDALIDVNEGDYFELQVYGTSTKCRIDGTLLRTSITVEVVK